MIQGGSLRDPLIDYVTTAISGFVACALLHELYLL